MKGRRALLKEKLYNYSREDSALKRVLRNKR